MNKINFPPSAHQINGVDMTNAHHDTAVQLLTDHQRFVRLVVQREVKGPLEPPQSPHSPSLLKGLSPSGYMANRPGYKRSSIGGTSPASAISESPTPTGNDHDHSKYIISNQYADTPKSSTAKIPKTNGIENNNNNVPQPVPAPRRLTSQSSIGSTVNGGPAPSQNGNKSEDESEAQVRCLSYSMIHVWFEIVANFSYW